MTAFVIKPAYNWAVGKRRGKIKLRRKAMLGAAVVVGFAGCGVFKKVASKKQKNHPRGAAAGKNRPRGLTAKRSALSRLLRKRPGRI